MHKNLVHLRHLHAFPREWIGLTHMVQNLPLGAVVDFMVPVQAHTTVRCACPPLLPHCLLTAMKLVAVLARVALVVDGGGSLTCVVGGVSSAIASLHACVTCVWDESVLRGVPTACCVGVAGWVCDCDSSLWVAPATCVACTAVPLGSGMVSLQRGQLPAVCLGLHGCCQRILPNVPLSMLTPCCYCASGPSPAGWVA